MFGFEVTSRYFTNATHFADNTAYLEEQRFAGQPRTLLYVRNGASRIVEGFSIRQMEAYTREGIWVEITHGLARALIHLEG